MNNGNIKALSLTKEMVSLPYIIDNLNIHSDKFNSFVYKVFNVAYRKNITTNIWLNYDNIKEEHISFSFHYSGYNPFIFSYRDYDKNLHSTMIHNISFSVKISYNSTFGFDTEVNIYSNILLKRHAIHSNLKEVFLLYLIITRLIRAIDNLNKYNNRHQYVDIEDDELNIFCKEKPRPNEPQEPFTERITLWT